MSCSMNSEREELWEKGKLRSSGGDILGPFGIQDK